MTRTFAGVDIGGKENTWLAILEWSERGSRLVTEQSSLQGIVDRCEEASVLSLAIDAQLTGSVAHENGYRPADTTLRELLPRDCQNWVASMNSLMAVPIRGRLLAEAAASIVGTILETHPRASLLFALGQSQEAMICNYKHRSDESEEAYRDRGGQAALEHLCGEWSRLFEIEVQSSDNRTDGELDAMVCATVASLYHLAPDRLRRLPGGGGQMSGRGPFYVVEALDPQSAELSSVRRRGEP